MGWPQAFFGALSFYTLLLPMQPKWLPITLGIMCMGLFWLLHGKFKEKLSALGKNWAAGLLFAYYFVVLLGLFYTQNPSKAEQELLSKIPLLAWPIMLSRSLGLRIEHLKKLILLFIYATTLAVVLAFLQSAVSYLAFPHSTVFYFSNFSFYKFIPPHYLGLYVNFAYGMLLIGWLQFPAWAPKKRYTISMLTILTMALLFISVRMQFLVFIGINIWAAFQYLKSKGFKLQAFLGISTLLVVFGALALSFKGSRARLVDAYHELKSINQPVDNKQTNPRFYLWPAAAEVIRDHFWLGTGAGSEKKYLNQKLEDSKALFWDGTKTYLLYEKGYNYHNSFLQHFAAQGVVGFGVFTALFLVPFYKARNHPLRSWAFLFLVISALSFLTESMLQRQAGVLFFSFFWCLFFVAPFSVSRSN